LLEIWDVIAGKKLFSIQNIGGATGIAFSPDSQILAVGMMGGVALLRAPTGEFIKSYEGEAGSVVFTPDGNLVAVTGNKEISILEIDTGQKLRIIQTEGYQFSLSPDGKTLIVNGIWDDKRRLWVTQIWDLENGLLINTLDFSGQSDRTSFSPDSRKFVSADVGDVVRVWDLKSGTLLKELEYSGKALSLAFRLSQTGSQESNDELIAGYDNGQIWLWDVIEGQIEQRF
jgi:WD40 repeat protein